MKLTVHFLFLFSFPPCEILCESNSQQLREEGENIEGTLNDGHFLWKHQVLTTSLPNLSTLLLGISLSFEAPGEQDPSRRFAFFTPTSLSCQPEAVCFFVSVLRGSSLVWREVWTNRPEAILPPSTPTAAAASFSPPSFLGRHFLIPGTMYRLTVPNLSWIHCRVLQPCGLASPCVAMF